MYPLNSPVAKKLVWWFIAISTIVALFSTGLQLYLDYRSEVDSIESYLSSLDETYLPSIAENTWIMDDNQVNTLLKGITNRDDIIYAAVSIDNTVQWSSGHKTDVHRFQAQLPIQYRNRNRLEHIGTLTVIANLEKVYQQLTRRALIVLFSNAVKTFIVAALALAAVQYLITRHLQAMSAHVSRMTVDEQHPQLRLDRKKDRQPDELDAVAQALSSMQERGYSAYREVLRGEQQLRLFLNSTEEGVFGIDSDGIVLFANTKCIQLLQLAVEEDIVGKNIPTSFIVDVRRNKPLLKTNDCWTRSWRARLFSVKIHIFPVLLTVGSMLQCEHIQHFRSVPVRVRWYSFTIPAVNESFTIRWSCSKRRWITLRFLSLSPTRTSILFM
jgi:PAS domain-containing protein